MKSVSVTPDTTEPSEKPERPGRAPSGPLGASRRLLVVVLVCACLLAGVLWYLNASRDSGGGAAATSTPTATGASATPSAPPPPSPVPLPAGALDATQAEALAEQVLAGQAQALADPVTADASTLLTDAALEEFRNQREEWESEQWHQEGAATVDGVEVLEASADSLTAQMCIDSSAVQVLDENGAQVRPADSPQRTRTIMTFVFVDGHWRLSGQSFAVEPDC
ncbi:MAG: hypothetical protein Q4C85_10725 [Actinomyces sp.]|uniref:DUF6318 family protein n=1 Tax=Actinomyces sp. TaxID=29317 RepID=UPI0026DD7709|nr:hypothetical protein [Actinomyces sp.]MDO4244207.1 hypothetical protein [Actinomyces sp.]